MDLLQTVEKMIKLSELLSSEWMTVRKLISAFIFFFLLTTGCKEPYTPPVNPSSVNYLVVDGFINSGAGPTTIKLSRTRSLSSTDSMPELNAHVTILDDLSQVYQLTEVGNGIYMLNQLNADYQRQYQLDIITSDGKEYRSDPVIPKQTPQIDSVHWEADNFGAHIYVNTHDPQNNSRYYRWSYEETWERKAAVNSGVIYDSGQVVLRPPSQQIFECWPTDTSTNILIGTSQNLSQDVIYRQPITTVSIGTEQISVLYSINIYQYVISEEAFNYWQLMKKNTEQLGSLFDVQPSQTAGNIHCLSNPAEPVVGYISVSSVTQQRIFINNSDLPYWGYIFPYECDSTITVAPDKISQVFQDSVLWIPVTININGSVVGATPECADCRYGGFSNQKPSFWP